MTNRVPGIVATMKHWLETTEAHPLQEFRLDRDAVRQLLAALADEPSVTRADECQCCDVMDPVVYTVQCKRCRAIQDSRERCPKTHTLRGVTSRCVRSAGHAGDCTYGALEA